MAPAKQATSALDSVMDAVDGVEETPATPVRTRGAVAAVGTTAVSTPVVKAVPQYETVSLEDESVASRSEFDWYKGRKNTVDRISIPNVRGIAMARQHFSETEGLGGILCRSKFVRQEREGPGGTKIYTEQMTEKAGCCDLLGESTKRFAVQILQYATTPKGELVKPVQFSMRVWRFTTDKFLELQAIHKEHGLDTKDLKVTCTDDKYQKMTFIPCGDSVYAHPGFAVNVPAIKNWLEATQGDLKRAIGRDMTDADIKKKLGEAPGGTAVAEAGPVADLDGLLS